jgi:hypothetical protein
MSKGSQRSKKSRDAREMAIGTAEESGASRSGERGLLEALGETRGAVLVEYVVLLSLVSVGGSALMIGLGVPLLHLYRFQQMFLVLPVP